MPRTASSCGIFWVIGSGAIARRWLPIVRESQRELPLQLARHARHGPSIDFLAL
jgi:hypothetical protein